MKKLKAINVVNKWLVPPSTKAWMIFPFAIYKTEKFKTAKTIRHENIHFQQCLECLVVFFYLIYVVDFIRNVVKGDPRKAYENIAFEREAYAHDKDKDYLDKRKRYAWLKNF